MKKTYFNPAMEVVKIASHKQILAGSNEQSGTPAPVNGDRNYESLGRGFDFFDED